ncbi:hypothetical protein BC937DRAFT_95002 [Endogone sp. FLAS-F59071]|nr:hypothetical protein BC937DRAFT_95002 [Endogone sp. FLAS-F59071]|eukprot:RUS20531.1 hypothetical protein BC937DRAFT_95002 [Endogone sp. FLAS-F59071]
MDTPSSSQEETATRKRFRHEEPSQFRHWRFSHAQLAEIRKANNAAAIERVKKNKEAEKNQRQDDDKTPAALETKAFEPTNANENDTKIDQAKPAKPTEGGVTSSTNPDEKAAIESSTKIDDSPKGAEGIEEPEVRYLTVDEELTLCSFYEFKLQQMALFCKLPDIVWVRVG